MNFYKNNKGTIITVIVLILIALGGRYFQKKATPIIVEVPSATTTLAATPQTHSDGVITFVVPKDFELALNSEQIIASSYIPPCSDIFNYCLYYTGSEYVGTNFEATGIRIQNRIDLKTVITCLNTSPTGYTGLRSTIMASTTNYTISLFQGIGDAAMGHYTNGELFRLAYDGTCYEFETRVGASQFANSVEGSIKEFTAADSKSVIQKLRDIITTITLKGGEKILF
ncbi:hypothetical protein H7Y21_03100 [Arenimonas sp.]|nr:hypothetical protein [Candidatus Parcubacteria bacterium]